MTITEIICKEIANIVYHCFQLAYIKSYCIRWNHLQGDLIELPDLFVLWIILDSGSLQQFASPYDTVHFTLLQLGSSSCPVTLFPWKSTEATELPVPSLLSRSVISDSATPWTVAHQAPVSMEIPQARLLEWVAMPSSRRLSQPRDQTQVSLNCRPILYHLRHQGSPMNQLATFIICTSFWPKK